MRGAQGISVLVLRHVLLVPTAQVENNIGVIGRVQIAQPLPASTAPPAHRQRLESSALWAATVQAALMASKIAPPPPAITARQGLRRLLE